MCVPTVAHWQTQVGGCGVSNRRLKTKVQPLDVAGSLQNSRTVHIGPFVFVLLYVVVRRIFRLHV